MAERKTVGIGTQATALGRAQAEEIVVTLGAAFPDLAPEVRESAASEEALVAGQIDLALHRAEDLPLTLPEGLAIGAVTRRLDGADALVAGDGVASLADLPAAARVGTVGLRRRALLLEARSDLAIVPLEEEVEICLAQLDAGEIDALMLAAADLRRLGLDARIGCVFDEEIFIPAAGQGALAVEVRAGECADLCAALDDPATRDEVEAERAFLRAVEAGGRAPVGVRGWLRERDVLLKAMIGSLVYGGVLGITEGRRMREGWDKIRGHLTG